MATKREKYGRRMHADYETKRLALLEHIAQDRPTLVAQALRIGEAKRALDEAEQGVNLQHLLAELHSRGLSPVAISRTTGYSERQVRRYIAEWKARTA